jgi:sulfoacetaldehyde acetyltransferase
MVSTDIGNICSVSNSYLRFDEPRSMLAAMSFGNCGYAFPVAGGAKLARPDWPAFACVGDGAWGISLNELLTCAREKIGVTFVPFNNEQWGAVAPSSGCKGIRVDKVSDVGAAIAQSVRKQAEGKTTVVEMMVTKELGDPFRRDALSKPVRHIDKYKNDV